MREVRIRAEFLSESMKGTEKFGDVRRQATEDINMDCGGARCYDVNWAPENLDRSFTKPL